MRAVDPAARGGEGREADLAPHAATRPTLGAVDPRADTLPSDGAPTLRGQPPPAADDPLIGRMMGHFRVDGLIGRGGMGTVYRAWDTSLFRAVALKVLLSDSASARARFLREARAQAQLRHPNVVPIHYVGDASGTVFLVMDLVEGESLADIVRQDGRVASERALDIVDMVASALEAAHNQGLIHRDVKPSNILVEPKGRALLADFGLAKDVSASASPSITLSGLGADEDPNRAPPSRGSAMLTRAGAIVGTPAYLAPEQAAGGHVDHRADMYALGASLYEALTGTPPFDAATPTGIVEQQRVGTPRPPGAILHDIHPSLEKLVLRMMEKQPADRFSTYAELREAIALARTPQLVAAAVFPRAVALAIDSMIVLMLMGVVGAVLSFLPGLHLWWLALALGVALSGLAEQRLGGAAIGKRLQHLRVVDRHGLTPGMGSMIARALLRHACFIGAVAFGELLPNGRLERTTLAILFVSGIIVFLPALWRERRTVYDRLTGTRVVFSPQAGSIWSLFRPGNGPPSRSRPKRAADRSGGT